MCAVNYANMYNGAYKRGYASDANLLRHYTWIQDYLDQLSIEDRAAFRMLDVGCGHGAFVNRLDSMGFNALGMDVSDIVVARAQAMRRNVIAGSICKIPFRDDYFDCVVTADTLEHLSPEDIEQAIKEAHRVSSDYVIHRICTRNAGTSHNSKRQNKMFFTGSGYTDPHLSVFKAEQWRKMMLGTVVASVQSNHDVTFVCRKHKGENDD